MPFLNGSIPDPLGGQHVNPTIPDTFDYRVGNKDGIFFVKNIQDDSGTGVSDFLEVFGGYGTKTGVGTINCFWFSLQHKSSGEAGLFIGDITAPADSAGGAIWGIHNVLTDQKGVKMVGARIELDSDVARPGTPNTDTIGLQVRNLNDSVPLDQGVRITGNWDRPLIIYGDFAASEILFDVDDFGNTRSAGNISLFTEDSGGTTNQILARQMESDTTPFLGTRSILDSQDRLSMRADGRLSWGPGNGASDTNLFRKTTAVLRTDHSLEVGVNLSLMGTTSAFIARAAGATTQTIFAGRLGTGDTVDRFAVRADGRTTYSHDGTNIGVYTQPLTGSVFQVNGKMAATTGIGVGNSAVATTSVGSLARKVEVFAADGTTSLGFIPVYATIT
jgi:hypothetical protein